jgi:hypothetical protein
MDHIPLYGDAEGYAEEVEEFLTGARNTPVPDRVLTTVMWIRCARAAADTVRALGIEMRSGSRERVADEREKRLSFT